MGSINILRRRPEYPPQMLLLRHVSGDNRAVTAPVHRNSYD